MHKPLAVEVDGILDLHTFRPREVPDLVLEYLRECRQRDIREVRIIHGKGKGVLRNRVQTILAQHPDVIDFGPAQDRSGWGATIVLLRGSKAATSDQAIDDQDKPKSLSTLIRRFWPWRL